MNDVLARLNVNRGLVRLEAWHAKNVSANQELLVLAAIEFLESTCQSIPYDRFRNSDPQRRIVKWLRKTAS